MDNESCLSGIIAALIAGILFGILLGAAVWNVP